MELNGHGDDSRMVKWGRRCLRKMQELVGGDRWDVISSSDRLGHLCRVVMAWAGANQPRASFRLACSTGSQGVGYLLRHYKVRYYMREELTSIMVDWKSLKSREVVESFMAT